MVQRKYDVWILDGIESDGQFSSDRSPWKDRKIQKFWKPSRLLYSLQKSFRNTFSYHVHRHHPASLSPFYIQSRHRHRNTHPRRELRLHGISRQYRITLEHHPFQCPSGLGLASCHNPGQYLPNLRLSDQTDETSRLLLRKQAGGRYPATRLRPRTHPPLHHEQLIRHDLLLRHLCHIQCHPADLQSNHLLHLSGR